MTYSKTQLWWISGALIALWTIASIWFFLRFSQTSQVFIAEQEMVKYYHNQHFFGTIIGDIELHEKQWNTHCTDTELCKHIRSVSATNYFGGALHEDFSNEDLPFKILCEASSPEAALLGLKSTVNYVNAHFFVAQSVNEEVQKLISRELFIQNEIHQIDSLLSLISENAKNKGWKEITGMRSQKISLFDQLLELQQQLKHQEAIVPISKARMLTLSPIDQLKTFVLRIFFGLVLLTGGTYILPGIISWVLGKSNSK